MKKIAFILSLGFALLGCNESKAQIKMYNNYTDTTTSGKASQASNLLSDTLYDASTIYTMYTRVGALGAAVGTKYVVTFDVTKVSGTGTARVYLQVSHDGITWRNANYASVSGATTLVPVVGTTGLNTDTLNIAAASTTALKYAIYYNPGTAATFAGTTYYIAGGRVFYMRLKIVGTGTQATIYSNAIVNTSL